MLDRCLRYYHNYILSMFISPTMPSEPCFIFSIIFAVLQLFFAHKAFLTLSFQTWIAGRILSCIGATHISAKRTQIIADQLAYLAFPLIVFQHGFLTALLLSVNNYMEMYSEKYKDLCIVGHTEIFLTYTACYLFPEFFDIIMLNFMGLVVLSIISGVLIGFQCKM
ncbi:unnamed protein product [Paramecium primaurelia]|uniref:Uncharacterized protein n=1 Tax=Paramecium primaurelia TaxID=5886 RepID=A0A8S1MGB1_PARPR|nr:unnamed protein product [Paramecium primaurelia]